MADTKRCPYCAESIRAEAVRCRYCRSRLTTFEIERWHRDHEEKRLAGVCAAVAQVSGFPTGGVRLGFVVLTFIHLLGPLVYGALWLIIPPAKGKESVLETLLADAHALAKRMSGRGKPDDSPPTPGRPGVEAPAGE